jgi:hypothetical protein
MKQEYPGYIDIDIISNATDSLYTAYFNQRNRKDDFKWKTVSTGVFHSLYLLLIAGLEMGNYNNVLQRSDSEEIYILVGDEKNWKKQRRVYRNEYIGSYTIEWDIIDYKPKFKERSEDDDNRRKKENLISFWTALARVLDSGTPKYMFIKYFTLSDKQWDSLEWVYSMVKELVLFVPTSMIQQTSMFYNHILNILDVLEIYLNNSKYLLMRIEKEETSKLNYLIEEIRTLVLKEQTLNQDK